MLVRSRPGAPNHHPDERRNVGPGVVKLSDSGGLQLWVTPQGGKYWRMAYRFASKQRVLAIGVYPATSLKVARSARDKAREALAAGLDPSQKKRLNRIAAQAVSVNTFSALADELLVKKAKEGKAHVTIDKMRWVLDFALPDLGARPISNITPPEVLAVLRKVEARGKPETPSTGLPLRHRYRAGRERSDAQLAWCTHGSDYEATRGDRSADPLRRLASRRPHLRRDAGKSWRRFSCWR